LKNGFAARQIAFEAQMLHAAAMTPQSMDQSMTSDLKYGPGGQLDHGKPRLSEDDIQREQLGPRGVPGKPDPAKMTPQRAGLKNIAKGRSCG